jgi:electron transfer flavoprotein alpha/beta subunit
MKADTATLVIQDGNSKPDPYTVAVVLAAAAKKLGGFDLILLGREAGDWGAGQTGGLLAEELGIPCVSFAETIESAASKLRIRRQTDWGYEVFEAEPPLVLTITNHEHNVPRIPKVRDVMMSYRQPLTKWTIDDLGIDAAAVRDGNAYYEVVDLAIQKKKRNANSSGATLRRSKRKCSPIAWRKSPARSRRVKPAWFSGTEVDYERHRHVSFCIRRLRQGRPGISRGGAKSIRTGRNAAACHSLRRRSR